MTCSYYRIIWTSDYLLNYEHTQNNYIHKYSPNERQILYNSLDSNKNYIMVYPIAYDDIELFKYLLYDGCVNICDNHTIYDDLDDLIDYVIERDDLSRSKAILSEFITSEKIYFLKKSKGTKLKQYTNSMTHIHSDDSMNTFINDNMKVLMTKTAYCLNTLSVCHYYGDCNINIAI